MKKPSKKKIVCYDFSKCTEYIEKKYKIDTRNVLKHSYQYPEPQNNPPYCDFWHFLTYNGFSGNNSLFTLYESLGEGAEDWQKQVLKYYLDEFGVKKGGERQILFHMEW